VIPKGMRRIKNKHLQCAGETMPVYSLPVDILIIGIKDGRSVVEEFAAVFAQITKSHWLSYSSITLEPRHNCVQKKYETHQGMLSKRG